MRRRPIGLATSRIFLATLLALGQAAADARAAGEEQVDFNRDIRPLLANHCFKCHGPDETERQADLRLDFKQGLLGDGDRAGVVVAGKPAESELVRRVESADPGERMPPPDAKLDLAPAQIELLRRWVEEGARWQQHWSFVPPRRHALPDVSQHQWVRNPIDRFVLARLEREAMRPAVAADKTTLIRRVTLDLTGLPPTPEELDAFLADTSPRAYEKVVDRLLQSPRFGERMAHVWLDAARYADTSGYQNDGPRTMWRWRDWVIDTYNRGLPFDQFTVEQLAGDLLPGATLEQRIATGFNRNHRGNSEGGVIPEEFQVEYVVDRVETTATVWLGLTLGCSRCHEHKYDPFSQEEFYRFFAFFNNIPEHGRAVKEGNSPPYVTAPTREQQRQLGLLDAALAEVERRFEAYRPELDEALSAWVDSLKPNQQLDWSLTDGLVAHFALDAESAAESETSPSLVFKRGEARYAEGLQGRAAQLDGQRFVEAGDVGDFGYFDRFSLAAWIHPAGTQGGSVLSRMTDVEQGDGYYVQLIDGRIHVNLVKRWLDDSIRVQSEAAVPPDRWTHVLVTYDGSRVAGGITVYLDGRSVPLQVNLDFINQSFATKEPLRIGGGGGPAGRFAGLIDEVRIFDLCLTPSDAAVLATADSISEIAATPAAQRSAGQSEKLRTYFLLHHAPPRIGETASELASLRRRREQLVESFPTVMVMEEMAESRRTFVLARGEYDKPAEPVSPGVPAIFPGVRRDTAPTRLDLARWLVDPSNPLTARVAVNRYWQMYFGAGLVKTTEDFGAQGERPSHPELLDWLATEFIRRDWDVKAMQRLIVTSATYRQSSRVTPELLARDSDNRLLARGPRFRLSAEVIRDQALAASGLLVERLGGPSVKPYQPGDLWKDIATDSNYVQDHGAALYRRSLYVYWKRTVVPPTMATFDAVAREMCTVRPRRTNTPLQALALMNDVTFVEAARMLAQSVLAGGAQTDDQRLQRLFRQVLSRGPSDRELQVVRDGLAQHLDEFRAEPEAAAALVASGEYPVNSQLDAAELAAYTTVASLILNLDEALTKQ